MSDHWRLTIRTTAPGQAYSLDINSGTGIDIDIDWGDGTVLKYTTTGIKSRTYALAGTYRVRVSGSMTAGNIRQDATGTYANAPKVRATSVIKGITGIANFRETLRGCTNLTAVPVDTFRNYPAIAVSGFYATFQSCTGLTALPTDLFRYNTALSGEGFISTFYGCAGLTALPTDLFRYNTAVSTQGFYETFYGCTKLQLNSWIFFATGEEGTRFLNRVSNLEGCFRLAAAFTGTQGTAPTLWDADYGSVMTIDVAPVTDWAATDIITGQTSGATCVIISKVTSTTYRVFKNRGVFTLGEIIGVTGNADKLADQGAAHPTFTLIPVKANCFTGHDAASLTNYGDIPADWRS